MIPIVARGIASLAGRMITRNPQLGKNIFSLLRKKPKGITVYRGDIVRNKYSLPKSEIGKMKSEIEATVGVESRNSSDHFCSLLSDF